MATIKYLTEIVRGWRILPKFLSKNKETGPPQRAGEDNDYALVINAPVEAQLLAAETPITIKGALSIYLETSLKELEIGVVRVPGFNLVFSDVPQQAISHRSTETEKATLSMPMHTTENIQLELNAERLAYNGTIPVRAYFPQLDEIFPPDLDELKDKDYLVSQTQPGSIYFSIEAGSLLAAIADPRKIEEITSLSWSAQVSIDPLQISDNIIPKYGLRIPTTASPVQTAFMRTSAVARHFRIQPVSIRASASDINPTGKGNGKGLNFGMPAVTDLWCKFGVVISVNQTWIFIDPPHPKVATEVQAEQILVAVEEKFTAAGIDNCIGVVFVENFNPDYLNGGGWTIKAGSNKPIIITSDGNVGQNDHTHLAHEMGHALGLRHPRDTDSRLLPSDQGTVMCESGWGRSNPPKNSEDNIKNVLGGTFQAVPGPIALDNLCRPNKPSNRCGRC